MFQHIARRVALLAATIGVLTVSAAPAQAGTVWADWTSATIGAPGSAAGSIGGVGVSYTGEIDNFTVDGSSGIWTPVSTFIGGGVTDAPSTKGDVIYLNGSSTATNTITFSSPVVNPLFAIWSLGNSTFSASFTFNAIPTLLSGGPNSIYGGQAVTVAGNTVTGVEGNGVLQFVGTYSSISWTGTFENFYGFTVGQNVAVPEPASMLLLAGGLVGLAARRRRSSRA